MPSIAQVVVGLPVAGPFDYRIPPDLQEKISAGSRVFVPFRNDALVGFVVGIKAKSQWGQLKSVLALLDDAPALDNNALTLTKKFAENYACSWGEAIEAYLPAGLRTKKILSFAPEVCAPRSGENSGSTTLCQDLSRDKRWPFIFERINQTLAQGRGVIFLVPEVHFIDPVRQKLEENLKLVPAVFDKKLSANKELEQWLLVKEGKARVAIGTRSAVFAPFNRLGLIIIQDEENFSYKQEQSPFYHSREVAFLRQEIEGAEILFVSPTPSLEVWRKMEKTPENFQEFSADHLAQLQLVDLANYKQKSQGTMSFALQNSIQETLAKNGKIVLFYNRRGFAAVTRCNKCGFTIKCPRCDVNLVYQYEKKKLTCHLCDHAADLPSICPQCNSSYLRSLGGGVEKVESDVARFFPQARVAFYDRETEKVPNEANVIVATQAIMKVLDQIQPDLIGMLDVDSQLNRFDYRSGERVFSLLVRFRQAATRKVVVQTYEPDHYCLKSAVKMDFKNFYKKETALRRELGFPPFKHLVAVGLRGVEQPDVCALAQKIQEQMKTDLPTGIELFDFQPDFVPKLRDKFRFTIMLKGANAKKMVSWVRGILKANKKSKVVVTINVDP